MARSIGGLSEFIELLEQQGEIRRVKKEVDPKYEIAAILSKENKEESPAIIFENVKGYHMPVAGNLLGTKRRLALSIFADEKELREGHLPNQDKRIKPILLKDQEDREIIPVEGAFDILDHIPVLTHYAKDSAPFITCGMASVRDPVSGGMRRGLHRLEVRNGSELGISLVNPPLSNIYAFHRKTGTPMEIAVSVGVDPVILLASVLKMSGEQDKLEAVGGLSGQPLPLEKCATVDLDIPAQSEIVIEGYINPKQAEQECTLGEVSGYYLSLSSPSIHTTAITFRSNPIFQALLPKSLEIDHILTLIHGLNIIPKMKVAFPMLCDIHFTPGIFGSSVVMSIDSDNTGDSRRALAMALSFPNIKKAVIVNDDVDPRNHQEVEWALATRFQADKDLITIPLLGGQTLDPSADAKFRTAKLGIDATRPQRHGFEKISFPEDVLPGEEYYL